MRPSAYSRVYVLRYRLDPGFKSAIAENPDDRTAKAVAADWLDDHDLAADEATGHHLRHYRGPLQMGETAEGKTWARPAGSEEALQFADPSHFAARHRLHRSAHSGPAGTFTVSEEHELGLPAALAIHRFDPVTQTMELSHYVPLQRRADPRDSLPLMQTLAQRLADPETPLPADDSDRMLLAGHDSIGREHATASAQRARSLTVATARSAARRAKARAVGSRSRRAASYPLR